MARQRVVRDTKECCTGDSIVVCLHRDLSGVTKGWYIGPLSVIGGKISLCYLEKRRSILGTIALLRAFEFASELEKDLIIYDPDDLLPTAWIS